MSSLYDIGHLYTLASIISGAVLLVLALQLFFTHIPKQPEWSQFRVATRMIGIACLALSCNEVNHFVTQTQSSEATNGFLLPVIIICVACYQAMLFTMTSVVLVNPKAIKARQVMIHLSIITVIYASLIAMTCTDKGNVHIYLYIATLIYMAYIFHLVLYFHREFKKAVRRLEELFEDDMMIRIRWVKHFFYSAFAIGLLALAVSFNPSPLFFTIFCIVVPIYYTIAEICLSNYVSTSSYIVRSSNAEAEAEKLDNEAVAALAEALIHTEGSKEMDRVKAAIDQWVSNKGYVNQDLTVDEIISAMGVKKTSFNSYFSNVLHTQFRTWRSELRVREAIGIISQNSDIATSELMDMVGYNDRSNFHKHFLQYAGMSINDYREKCNSAAGKAAE